MTITITEALAEIKTVEKRVESKRNYILGYLYRPDGMRDPLAGDGGAVSVIERERQSIGDLETRIVSLRRGIQLANDMTRVTINGTTRSISEWLIWRREVSSGHTMFLGRLRQKVEEARAHARKLGANVVGPNGTPERPADILVHISESDLAKEIETTTDTLGQLDGMLSLKNATVPIVDFS